MLALAQNSILCSHIALDNAVHEFVLTSPSPAAIDQWFGHLTTVFNNSTPNQPARILLDIQQSGLPPLVYTIQTARQYLTKCPQPPLTPRIVLLHKPGFPKALVESFVRLARLSVQYKLAFFLGDERSQAITWLAASE